MALDEVRRAQLVTSIGAVRGRIVDACTAVGRDPRTVTLIAVTKTYPASDVAALAQIGVLDVGESKDQEARAKIAELQELAAGETSRLRWHLIGRLQTNKARSVAGYAHAVHSVDRAKLVRALGQAAVERTTPLEVFVQVSLDDDPERGGVSPAGVGDLAAAVAEYPQLSLRGLMSVPPIGADPDPAFARLAELSQQLRQTYPHADCISAGMSEDLAVAIRHGATHVRVGTALLGRREQDIG